MRELEWKSLGGIHLSCYLIFRACDSLYFVEEQMQLKTIYRKEVVAINNFFSVDISYELSQYLLDSDVQQAACKM